MKRWQGAYEDGNHALEYINKGWRTVNDYPDDANVHFANALRALKGLPNFRKCTKVTTISKRDIEELQEWHDNLHNEAACGGLAADMSIETKRLNKSINDNNSNNLVNSQAPIPFDGEWI